ncbi:MAG: replicative DNA helicase [Patescibacteria group bacterium]|nr:replicative DNA helicase [Patescibacteria group bacterium]MCL5261741.1 replicative DNA helicase [Patescibacteria group bacterium]
MDSKELKLPPQDLDAEQSVLGAILIDKEALANIADVVDANDFYKKANADIYRACFKLWEKGEPIDILSVTSELKKTNLIQQVGGSGYLAELVNSVPSSAHVSHYAKIVKEKKILRDLINASQEITENALGSADDLDILLDGVEQRIFSISKASVSRNFVPIKEELRNAYERIAELEQGDGKLRGVPTGFAALDNMLSGLQKSDLIIVGARPSFGKTSFALDIGRYVASKANLPVGIFSLEMSREQVVDRLIATEARVDLWKLRTGRIGKTDPTEYDMIQAALDRLSRAPIYIEDTPSPNIIELRRMARRLQAEAKNLSLIIVDYLQLIQPRKNYDSAVQQVTEVSRGLKALARELNVPVIAISQLSRAVDQRDNKAPRLSDLRDSGSIEQDADVVIFINPIWRQKDPRAIDPNEDGETEIIIAKHRNGPIGTVKLKFNKNLVSFENIDTFHDNPGIN